jgi:1-hydroxycarotenoid 3,4-desaturase
VAGAQLAGDQVVIIGAGIGGLSSAIALAAQGCAVTVVESHARSGGKMREAEVGGTWIDCGPTVFTMRWVFDALFAVGAARLTDHIRLHRLDTLARHAWTGDERLDLFADPARSAAAIGDFAGADEARRFTAFCAEARTIYRTLKDPFLRSPKPTPLSLSHRIGLHRPAALFGIRPFGTLWKSLCRNFRDPRLRQLFGRYATYSGSSPFLAPATLMLIAHVEQDGVWAIEGGMQRLADALETVARKLGVQFHFGTTVQKILVQGGRAAGVALSAGEPMAADAVIVNADSNALADGLFGKDTADCVAPTARSDRSLSAVTWAMTAHCTGFSLRHHNVFFSPDYRAEFDALLGDLRLPAQPTVYVCAPDRSDTDTNPGHERLFMLVNAPATGDEHEFAPEEIEKCLNQVLARLAGCGLSLRPEAITATTPSDFHRRFPGTGGALYGRASHGWRASFRRPGAATSIPGLYLAGGSAHPGAGVPMAALSGQLAAQRLLADLASMRPFRRAATSGGT